MNQDEVFAMCDRVRETSMSLHRYLRHGHLEKVYENGLASRLRKAGHHVQQQFPLTVHDEDGTALGNYFADLLVDGWLLLELKATAAFSSEDVAQILGYLRGCRLEHGMLINFGSPKLGIRKFVLSESS